MTVSYFVVALVVVGCGAVFWGSLGRAGRLDRYFTGNDTIGSSLVETVAVIFGLFVGFGAAEIRDRSHDLRLAAQQESDIARSIFKFAEGIGITAEPLRQALIQYLQATVALDPDWVASQSTSESPAQAMSEQLVLVAVLLTTQPKIPDPMKSLIVTNVDRLRQAGVSRQSLSRQSSGVAEWSAMTLLALITQAMIALTHIGKGRASLAAVAAFSFAVRSLYLYLAWIEGLIGVSKIAISVGPLRELLASLGY
jgi:hypothetical protein